MTVWKPLTCDCVVEYDQNRNFIRALGKCAKHEKYEGNEFLLKVVADNKNITVKANPKKGFWSRFK